MKRQHVLLIATIIGCTAGCNMQSPRFDPFLGRTTVPPPATGHIVSPIPGTTDPYYPPGTTNVPGPAPSSTGSVVPQSGTSPQTIPVTPQQGSVNSRRGDSLVTRPTSTTKKPSAVVQAAHTSDIRIVEPEADKSTATDSNEPGRFRAAADAAPLSAKSRAAGGDVDSTSHSSQDYGFAPDYRWLQGTLEYSRIDRQWKLRYIPIDGDTDDYGGSVLLPDSAELADLEPGAFVRVEGQIAAGRGDDTGFAPLYRYRTIEVL